MEKLILFCAWAAARKLELLQLKLQPEGILGNSLEAVAGQLTDLTEETYAALTGLNEQLQTAKQQDSAASEYLLLNEIAEREEQLDRLHSAIGQLGGALQIVSCSSYSGCFACTELEDCV